MNYKHEKHKQKLKGQNSFNLGKPLTKSILVRKINMISLQIFLPWNNEFKVKNFYPFLKV